MELLATLHRSGGINAVAGQLGVPPSRVFSGVEMLLPALVSGMRGHVRRFGGGEGGVAQLIRLFDAEGDGSLAVDVMSLDKVDPRRGVNLLLRIFETDAAVDAVIAKQSEQDIGAPLLGQIFPLLMMLVGGYVSAQAAGSGAEGTGGPRSLGELYDELVQ